jgi:hypothetical protein
MNTTQFFTSLQQLPIWSGLVNDVRTFFGENGSKFAIPDLMSEK